MERTQNREKERMKKIRRQPKNMPDASQGQEGLGWDLSMEPATFFPEYREMVRTRRGLAQILIGQEMPPAEWRNLVEQRPAFAPFIASSRSGADAVHVGYIERGGAIWGVGNFRERQLLSVEQACRIVAAADRPLPGETTNSNADDLFRRLAEEIAVLRISVSPSTLLQDFFDQFTDTVLDEEKIEHLQLVGQLHQDWGRVTRAIGNVASAEWHFCMIRAAVTGNTDKRVIDRLDEQAAGGARYSRGMHGDELTHACTGITPALTAFRSIVPEIRKRDDRLSFMRNIHTRELKKQPGDMQFFVCALASDFEDSFNAKAAGGWKHQAPSRDDDYPATNKADSGFIRYASSFFTDVGFPRAENTIQTDLYRGKKRAEPARSSVEKTARKKTVHRPKAKQSEGR